MGKDSCSADSYRQADLDPSKPNMDDIRRVRDTIIENARRKVDPARTGFDATMSDESGGFTDDGEFAHWWDWIEQIVRVISDGSTRIGLGVIAAGAAIASGLMFSSDRGSAYGGVTLIVAAGFAAWFAISAAVSAIRSR